MKATNFLPLFLLLSAAADLGCFFLAFISYLKKAVRQPKTRHRLTRDEENFVVARQLLHTHCWQYQELTSGLAAVEKTTCVLNVSLISFLEWWQRAFQFGYSMNSSSEWSSQFLKGFSRGAWWARGQQLSKMSFFQHRKILFMYFLQA